MAWVEEWRWQAGTSGIDNINLAAMHPNGSSCVLAGSTSRNWSTTNAGDSDFIAMKLDIDGNILWEWQNGTIDEEYLTSGGVANDGSAILAGGTFGGYAAENAGSADFVVIKLDENGEVLWRLQDGTIARDMWYGLAMSIDGSVVLAGTTGGSWNASSSGSYDWAAMKLDAEGKVMWKWQDGDSGMDFLSGAALNGDDSVVFAGVFNGSDFAAVKLDANGSKIWDWQDGTGDDDQFYAIAATGSGSVVLAGYSYGNWSGTNAGASDFAAVKLDANGTEVWRWQEGSDFSDCINGAVAVKEGSVILVGETYGDFVGTNQGYRDFAAVELASNGTVLWRWQNGTEDEDYLKSVAANKNGQLLMAGVTKGVWNGFNSGRKDFAAVLFDVQSTLPSMPVPTSPPFAEPTGLSTMPSPTTPPPSDEHTELPTTPSPTTKPSTAGFSELPASSSPTFHSSVGPAERSFSTVMIVVVVASVGAATAALLAVCLWRRFTRSKDEGRNLAREMNASQMLRSPVAGLSKSVILPKDSSYGPYVADRRMAAPPAPPETTFKLAKSAASAGLEDPTKVVKVGGQDHVTGDRGAMLTSTIETSLTPVALSHGPLPYDPSIGIVPGRTVSESDAESAAVSTNITRSEVLGGVGISTALAVLEAASAVANASSIPGVSEAARLVSVLVKLVVDKKDNDIAEDWRVGWCRSIVAVLERASELIERVSEMNAQRDEIGRNTERYLLEDVYDSVRDLVDTMQTYNSKGTISRLFTSTLFKRRQEEAEAVINRAILRLQLDLQVQAGHDIISVRQDVREIKAERKTEEKSPEKRSITDSAKHEMIESRRARQKRRLQQMEIPEDQLTLTDVLLGKGGFGEVYLADYCGVNVAAKVLKINNDHSQESNLYEFDSVADEEERARQLELQANQRNMFFRELQVMTRLKSPHTVQVFGAITSQKDRFVLVMELMPGGDLCTLLRQTGKRLPELQTCRIMKFICSGMAFLHNRGVIHGDLKSANVLFDSAGTAKIADFGTARWTQHMASTGLASTFFTNTSNITNTSIAWAAPEVLDNELISFESDVYSFGVVAWEIATRKMPWASLNGRTIIRRVLSGERPEIPRGASADLAEVIISSWHDNPRERLKFAEIFDRINSWSKRDLCSNIHRP